MKRDPRILSKLRMARGDNYITCHAAADEIKRLRNEITAKDAVIETLRDSLSKSETVVKLHRL